MNANCSLHPRVLFNVQRLPLWSSNQSSWLLTQRSWVRFPALPNFLRSSGSGTGPIRLREHKWGAVWKKKVSDRSRKLRLRPWGIRWADHATSLYRKSWHQISPSGGRSVGIVRLQSKNNGVCLFDFLKLLGIFCLQAPWGALYVVTNNNKLANLNAQTILSLG
jgi:hypothetical protein